MHAKNSARFAPILTQFSPTLPDLSTGNMRTIRLHWLKVNEIVRIFCFLNRFAQKIRLEFAQNRIWSVECDYAETGVVERKSG